VRTIHETYCSWYFRYSPNVDGVVVNFKLSASLPWLLLRLAFDALVVRFNSVTCLVQSISLALQFCTSLCLYDVFSNLPNRSWRTYIAVNITPQHHMFWAFFSIYVQDIFNYPIYMYICNILLFHAVPLRIFALHVGRVYPRSRTEGPKIETRIESGFNFLRKAQQSPHQLMDLKRERIKHPNGPAASRFCTRSPGQRYNK